MPLLCQCIAIHNIQSFWYRLMTVFSWFVEMKRRPHACIEPIGLQEIRIVSQPKHHTQVNHWPIKEGRGNFDLSCNKRRNLVPIKCANWSSDEQSFESHVVLCVSLPLLINSIGCVCAWLTRTTYRLPPIAGLVNDSSVCTLNTWNNHNSWNTSLFPWSVAMYVTFNRWFGVTAFGCCLWESLLTGNELEH